MARKSFHAFPEFLANVVRFWDQLGDDFRFGPWNKSTVTEKKAEFEALNTLIFDLELDLKTARIRRDAMALEVEGFGVKLRNMVMGTFGIKSDQYHLMPRLLKHDVGRPNKAAAARKAATLKRKAAAIEAAKTSTS